MVYCTFIVQYEGIVLFIVTSQCSVVRSFIVVNDIYKTMHSSLSPSRFQVHVIIIIDIDIIFIVKGTLALRNMLF